jgi:acyl-CoA hydrolase
MGNMIDQIINNFSLMTKEGITETYSLIQEALIKNNLLTPEKIEAEKVIKNHKVKEFKSSGQLTEIFSHIVMHTDLNPAETMYGGRMLELCDESGCIFLFKELKVRRLVTVEMQNVFFLCSPKLGDIVVFYGEILELRKASVWIRIMAKNITAENEPTVIDCQMRFCFIDKIKK